MVSELDEFLSARSSLTRKQIERLSAQISARTTVKNGPVTTQRHKTNGISEGTYYRVLGQARNNIQEAIYTILLCSRMGLIRLEDVSRLVGLMEQVPRDLPESSKEVISLTDALVRKIVML